MLAFLTRAYKQTWWQLFRTRHTCTCGGIMDCPGLPWNPGGIVILGGMECCGDPYGECCGAGNERIFGDGDGDGCGGGNERICGDDCWYGKPPGGYDANIPE